RGEEEPGASAKREASVAGDAERSRTYNSERSSKQRWTAREVAKASVTGGCALRSPGARRRRKEERSLNIAVSGATRGIGREVVKAALEDGHHVTVLVRNPGRLAVRHERLRIETGDALDPDAVARVVEGQDVVCDCLGTKNVFKKVTLFSRAAENLARALKPQQLLIAVTGVGAGDSKGHGGFFYDRLVLPLVVRRIYADKDRQEEIIRRRVAR